MTISYYTVTITNNTNSQTYTGYFSADNTTNVVTGYYETSDYATNILLDPNTTLSGSLYTSIFTTSNMSFNNTGIYFNSRLNNIFGDSTPKLICIFDKYTLLKNYSPMNNVSISIQSAGGSGTQPISNICFPAKTPIKTDQGNIDIDKINPQIHTIHKKKIECITKTITLDKYLVCFEKDSLGNNIPNQRTLISKNHLIFYKGEMLEAKKFIGKYNNIKKVAYSGETLYNVLMEDHNKMLVNNMICETLDPDNTISHLYRSIKNLSPNQQEDFIKQLNTYTIKNNIYSSKRK
uniref:Hedgehog/Intein (Hint) domain-containing protein n=1 Tax=viral metagenome TaxID=1070528 RepID=A0A6C0EQT2_9ZZZZ